MTASVVWPDLTPMQADGLSCVLCATNYLINRHRAHRPVGRSHTGSQVFACLGECEQSLTDAWTEWVCDDCTTPYGWHDAEALDTCPCGGYLRPIGPDGFEVTR